MAKLDSEELRERVCLMLEEYDAAGSALAKLDDPAGDEPTAEMFITSGDEDFVELGIDFEIAKTALRAQRDMVALELAALGIEVQEATA